MWCGTGQRSSHNALFPPAPPSSSSSGQEQWRNALQPRDGVASVDGFCNRLMKLATAPGLCLTASLGGRDGRTKELRCCTLMERTPVAFSSLCHETCNSCSNLHSITRWTADAALAWTFGLRLWRHFFRLLTAQSARKPDIATTAHQQCERGQKLIYADAFIRRRAFHSFASRLSKMGTIVTRRSLFVGPGIALAAKSLHRIAHASLWSHHVEFSLDLGIFVALSFYFRASALTSLVRPCVVVTNVDFVAS